MADIQSTVARQPKFPPTRPEYLCDVVASGDIGVVQKPLTLWERLVNQAWLRKLFILVVIATAWQLYALQLNNPLLVPTFTATIEAFWTAMMNGDLPQKVANSVLLLLKGYAIGLALSRQIAEAHGGSLTLENRSHAIGCIARLRLPLG